jgi:hypothetical protein
MLVPFLKALTGVTQGGGEEGLPHSGGHCNGYLHQKWVGDLRFKKL